MIQPICLLKAVVLQAVEFLEAQPFSGVAIDPQDEFGNHGAGKSVNTIRNVLIESSES